MSTSTDRDRKRKIARKMKTYKRDKRSPTPSSPLASKIMSRIKCKNTKPEMIVRKLLWAAGDRAYRLQYPVAGRPDIAFPRTKVAIFIHGCFWHRCPICQLQTPKSNPSFWQNKFEQNVKRDKSKISLLEKNGWKIVVLWECEIKNNPHDALNHVQKFLKPRV